MVSKTTTIRILLSIWSLWVFILVVSPILFYFYGVGCGPAVEVWAIAVVSTGIFELSLSPFFRDWRRRFCNPCKKSF